MSTHANEKSDSIVVPMKVSNNDAQALAEELEGRVGPEGNRQQYAANGTQGSGIASTGLLAVRQVAKRDKDIRFTALLHHITPELLRLAYHALTRDAAPGIDGVTWQQYGNQLEQRLDVLHQQVHAGSYRAKPARRTFIPKPDGTQRPLSILCVEDKIVQQAVVYVLNAIYEADFVGFSYGFRPGRGTHDALDALSVALHEKRISWVLDADISKFFDSLSQDHLVKFLEHRIADRRLLRLIRKWLKVGVMENGQHILGTIGSPQGAPISPVLANVYLHYVYDLWINAWRQHKTTGEVIVVRYADDSIVGFEHAWDAKAFLAALTERLAKFDLKLHPEKTRLLRFGRYAKAQCKREGLGKPETFDFLGFTHYCTVDRKGRFTIRRKTIKKRLRAKLQAVKEELRKRINDPLGKTGLWLKRVLTGHINYYGVPGNGKSVSAFFYQVSRLWMRTLRRRSQRHRMTWERFAPIISFFFPAARVTHPWPEQRFNAKTRGKSPVREQRTPGSVRGASSN